MNQNAETRNRKGKPNWIKWRVLLGRALKSFESTSSDKSSTTPCSSRASPASWLWPSLVLSARKVKILELRPRFHWGTAIATVTLSDLLEGKGLPIAWRFRALVVGDRTVYAVVMTRVLRHELHVWEKWGLGSGYDRSENTTTRKKRIQKMTVKIVMFGERLLTVFWEIKKNL